MKIAWEDYLDKAHDLINSRYPVQSDDPIVLAKIMFEKQKDININVNNKGASHDAGTSTSSRHKE